MRRSLAAILLGAVGALSLAFFTTAGAGDNLLFHLGMMDMEPAEREAELTVRMFDKLYVRFYTSGGDLTGLNVFPAANLVKRRIVQDINSWAEQGMILSHDRMVFEVKAVRIIGPATAIVETNEIWQYIIRDLVTGSRTKEGKSNLIKVRYILRSSGGKWRVEEFEVFGAGDKLPPLGKLWSM